MEFRAKTQTGCLIFAVASFAAAADFPVTHVHLRKDQPGRLSIGPGGIEYRETKRHKKPHEYKWAWNDMQRIVLWPDRIEIGTYKDVRWQFGRDRQFAFKGAGLDAACTLLESKLPRRLVREVASGALPDATRLPAKRLEGQSGHEGTLLVGADRLIFQSGTLRGSHTWPLTEVDNISTSDPLELVVSSLGADYRLQLKQPLPGIVYDDLWRKLNTGRTTP